MISDPNDNVKRSVRGLVSTVSVIGLSLALAGCSTVYRSSRVVPGANDGTQVRVVPINGETVYQANKSPYNPQTLPAIFSITALPSKYFRSTVNTGFFSSLTL